MLQTQSVAWYARRLVGLQRNGRSGWCGTRQEEGPGPGPPSLEKDPKQHNTKKLSHSKVTFLESSLKQVKYQYKGKVHGAAPGASKEHQPLPRSSPALLAPALVTRTPSPYAAQRPGGHSPDSQNHPRLNLDIEVHCVRHL